MAGVDSKTGVMALAATVFKAYGDRISFILMSFFNAVVCFFCFVMFLVYGLWFSSVIPLIGFFVNVYFVYSLISNYLVSKDSKVLELMKVGKR